MNTFFSYFILFLTVLFLFFQLLLYCIILFHLICLLFQHFYLQLLLFRNKYLEDSLLIFPIYPVCAPRTIRCWFYVLYVIVYV